MIFSYFSDMASEIREEKVKTYAEDSTGKLDGVEYSEYERYGVKINKISIISEEGEKILSKPLGDYITVQTGDILHKEESEIQSIASAISDEIVYMSKKLGYYGGRVIAVGLGNKNLTSDSLGPVVCDGLIVTSHLKEQNPKLYSDLHFGDLSAFCPGVLAQTGMESSSLVLAVCKSYDAKLVLAIDSLAAKEVGNLCSCVQICSCGISPGSGVGNYRKELTKDLLGVPVISVGVPMVVDSKTLVFESISKLFPDKTDILQTADIFPDRSYFVTPRDIDICSQNFGDLIAMAINRAFHKNLSFEDMAQI